MAAAGRKSERGAVGFFAIVGRDAAGPEARLVVVEVCTAGLTGLGGLKAGPFRRAVFAAFGGMVGGRGQGTRLSMVVVDAPRAAALLSHGKHVIT